ncbi:bcl-2-like protein 11 isoform X2 [Denticeps clupeoides]|uniref:Bcl-x interacting BH3 domain-containing protein n=1 Tax=Denticeps clupeoides TaxID=299321 RepID=A0AAY4BKY5_9TELE|nr:bcl-2-like protein 11 isoform X2 [Denticeps clupeoides]
MSRLSRRPNGPAVTERAASPPPAEGSPSASGRTASSSSSGYCSDSVPGSPLATHHDRSTQTPSPASQAVAHAQQRLDRARRGGRSHEPWPRPTSPCRERSEASAGVMRDQVVELAEELRRMGDEFNQLYFNRVPAGRNGQIARPGQQLQPHHDAGVMRFLGRLMGRLLQLILWRR